MLLHPSLSYGILSLIRDYKFDAIKFNTHPDLHKNKLAARKILIESALFVEQHITCNQQGFEFYLELKTGNYPKNIADSFKKHNIVISYPKHHRRNPHFHIGIFISIGHYPIKSMLVAAMNKFIKALKIIMEKHLKNKLKRAAKITN